MNMGVLTVDIWPPYVGLASGDPGPFGEHEPLEDASYERGLISWRTDEHGLIWGRAEVHAPKGVYTHVVFFSGPGRGHPVMRANLLEQAIVFDRAGVVEIDPIVNKDYLPRL